jgi:thymidine phosphorylase
LREHALLLAGRVLDLDPALPGGQGRARATELLDNGAALAAMHRLMREQGPPPQVAVLGPLVHDITAPSAGHVSAIDCHRIARIARLAGAPMDKGAGIDLFCKVGAQVTAGQPLYRIHAAAPAGLAYARELAAEDDGFALLP